MTGPPQAQLTLDWPHRRASGRADFLISDSNRAALAWIDRWPDWPGRGLALHGPAGSGKTHLAQLWCVRAAARVIDGEALSEDDAAEIAGNVAIDGADRAAEPALLHLYNACREQGGSILIVARQPPAFWPTALADLASRLRALPTAGTAAPDDALLAAVLVKHFADRQVRVAPEVIAYLIRRMERSFAGAALLAERLDKLALSEGCAVTIPVARRVLAANP